MKALISGGGGFIGFNLAKKIIGAGGQAHVLDNNVKLKNDVEFMEFTNCSLVEFIEVDFASKDWFDVVDDDYTHYVHLAAMLGVDNVISHPLATLNVNAELTISFVKRALLQPSKPHFLFASTSEVYAGTMAQGTIEVPTPEECPIILPDISSPRVSYMLSKLYGEAIVTHSGLPHTIFRPHNIYGPRMGMRHVIPQLMQRAVSTEADFLEVFSPFHSRTFCYIDDAVEQLFRLMRRDALSGEVVNIGNEKPEVTMFQLAEMVLKMVNKNVPIKAGKDTVGSPRRRCPKMRKCFEMTSYNNKVGLQLGLEKTFRWYFQNIFQ